jgi:thioredoxin 1
MHATALNEKNFEEEVRKSSLPVLVDFWAEWCGPCKMIGPIIEELAVDLKDQLKVCKVNVDEAQELAAKFNVMSIPTLLVFKNGEVVGQMVGAMSKDALLAKLKPHLGS